MTEDEAAELIEQVHALDREGVVGWWFPEDDEQSMPERLRLLAEAWEMNNVRLEREWTQRRTELLRQQQRRENA